jgi:hypothetical protein
MTAMDTLRSNWYSFFLFVCGLTHHCLTHQQASSYIDENGGLMLGGFQPPPQRSVVTQHPSNAVSSPSLLFPTADNMHVDVDAEELCHDFEGYDSHGYDGADFGAYHAPEPAPTALTKTKTKTAGVQAQTRQSSKVYVLLDPHQLTSGRPLRKGRTYKLPAALRKQQQQQQADATADAYDPDEELYDPSIQQQEDGWNRFLQHKALGSGRLFAPMLLPLLQARKAIDRKLAAMRRFPHRGDAEQDAEQDGEEGVYEGQDAISDMIYGTHDPDQNQEPPLQREQPQARLLQGQYECDYDNMDYSHDDLDYGLGLGCAPAALEEEEELARRVEAALGADPPSSHSYELICKQFIDSFHRGAAAFARESVLSKRVNDWTNRLEPILRAQEEAQAFDIHACSDEVLERLRVKTDTACKHLELSGQEEMAKQPIVGFADLAQGHDSAQVCRMFLACLQLANLGNVEIVSISTHPAKQPVVTENSFRLKLLAEKRKSDIQSFRAPSLLVEE